MYKTNHQKLLINYFLKNQEEKYTALDLIEKFKNQMDKSTIYRKLKILEEQKTIHKNYNPMKNLYEYQYSIKGLTYLHLACKDCGKIIPVKCEKMIDFVVHLTDYHQFVMDEGNTLIFGLCKECANHA